MSRGQGKNPESFVRYHEGYVYDKIRYTVLTASQVSEADVRKIQAATKTVISGVEASTMPKTPGWSCQVLDQRGRVLLLSYKGIEVGLFYQRQLSEVKLQAGDKFPEGVCQDPRDAWQRLDLLGRSARQSNIILTNVHSRLEEENQLLKQRIQTLETLNDKYESELKDATQSLNRLRNKMKAKVIPITTKKRKKV